MLIADSRKDDRFLLKIVIRKRAPSLEIIAELSDAPSLVRYLAGEGKYANREVYPYPELLILGSGMSSMDGFDVIEWIRAQSLPSLKIAVLAEPMPPEEQPQAHAEGSDYLFSKTCELRELERIVKLLELSFACG